MPGSVVTATPRPASASPSPQYSPTWNGPVGENPDDASPPARNSSPRQKPPTPAGSTARQRTCSAGGGVDVPSHPNSLDIPIRPARFRVLNPGNGGQAYAEAWPNSNPADWDQAGRPLVPALHRLVAGHGHRLVVELDPGVGAQVQAVAQ